MNNLNGALIRALVDKLPPHVFDEIVYHYPYLLECEEWYSEYYHWEPFDGVKQTYDDICEDWGLDPQDPEVFLQEFEDGVLIIE